MRHWSLVVFAAASVLLLVVSLLTPSVTYESVAGRTVDAQQSPAQAPAQSPSAIPLSEPLPSFDDYLHISFERPKLDSGMPQGTAPFAIEVVAQASRGYHDARTTRCSEVTWNWGDGTHDTYPCNSFAENVPSRGQHVYDKPGIYYLRAQLIYDTGRKADSFSSAVVVEHAITATQGGSSTFFYWGLWLLSLIALVAGWIALGLPWAKRGLKRVGRLVLVLLLFTFVPPFSFVPNPIGIVWSALGTYSYDPRLPFVNRFLIAGDPTPRLIQRLNGLIGQKGLDPLDPQHALTGYSFKQVSLPDRSRGGGHGYVFVTTEMTYADGSKRDIDIPVDVHNSFLYVYLSFEKQYYNWNELNRVYAEHVELPLTPFAGKDAPWALGAPQRLQLHPGTKQITLTDSDNWARIAGGTDRPQQNLLVSPKGDNLLMSQPIGWSQDYPVSDLWLVNLAGEPPRKLAEGVLHYDWSPDGSFIVYNLNSSTSFTYAIRPDGTARHQLSVPERDLSRLPGINLEGVWYVKDGRVWVAPFDGSPAEQLASFADMPVQTIYPSPDGASIAYSDGAVIRLWHQDAAGSIETEVTSLTWGKSRYDIRDIAWSPDGTTVAVVTRLYADQWSRNADVRINILGRDGTLAHSVQLAADGSARTPIWLPDNRHIMVQITPYGGRRIVVVDSQTGRAWDLTRPRWDPWFAVAPDAHFLLLSNGRGSFWRADLLTVAKPIGP